MVTTSGHIYQLRQGLQGFRILKVTKMRIQEASQNSATRLNKVVDNTTQMARQNVTSF